MAQATLSARFAGIHLGWHGEAVTDEVAAPKGSNAPIKPLCTKAFPSRGRWHGEAVTDEVAAPKGSTAPEKCPRTRKAAPQNSSLREGAIDALSFESMCIVHTRIAASLRSSQ